MHIKRLLIIIILPLTIFATQLGDLDGISQSLRSGNAKSLSEYFDTSVELKILDKEGAYSKAQAEEIVKDFFAKNVPSDFSFIHDGPSGGNNAHYAIGKLTTSNGKFRTYMYMKKKGDTFVIQELSFENE